MTPPPRVGLGSIAGQWLRLGSLGFGGPPAHIAMLEQLCVRRRGWLSDVDFWHALAAVNLLPGPASTQLAIYCAWRLRGAVGGIVGGICFIAPGLVAILFLSALLLGTAPNTYVLGAAAGAGAAVAAVAVHAASSLVPGSWARTGEAFAARGRWALYLAAGGVTSALVGQWVALAILAAGLVEATVRVRRAQPSTLALGFALPTLGPLAALTVVAVKVGALSYGGGFVIIPLMQSDAVHRYHWLTDAQFNSAVALGQITPGPVVHTVAAVGYGAAGVAGGLLAAVVAFAPSFLFVLLGGRQFDRLRDNVWVQAFLTGAAPAAIGAIAGSAVVLGLVIGDLWQFGVLLAAALWLLALRRGVVSALVGAGAAGLVAAALGWPLT
jgi:chromate transporter